MYKEKVRFGFDDQKNREILRANELSRVIDYIGHPHDVAVENKQIALARSSLHWKMASEGE
jgi:hypothetical protein